MKISQEEMKMALKQIGSVGATWPPFYNEPNARVKGFCPDRIGTRGDLRRGFETAEGVERTAPQATRTTIRAFVENGLLEGLQRERDVEGFRIEAAIPVDNALVGYSIAYFGRNKPERMPTPESLQAEMEGLGRVLSEVRPIDTQEAVAKVRLAECCITRIDSNGGFDADVSRLRDLYREAYQRYTIEMTEDTIRGLLDNGNLVVVAREDTRREIVASLIAEHCIVQVGGQEVHLYELNDFATFRSHRRRGLMTLMQMDAVLAIHRLHKGKAIVYAEDRAAWEPVNRASQRAGLYYRGTLLQHCVLEADRSYGETGSMENLNVWSI